MDIENPNMLTTEGEQSQAQIVPSNDSSANQAQNNQVPADFTADSPHDLNGPFPAELAKWNWGAFFLTWIWAIGNKVWIGLLALLGPLGIVMAVILGIKGNEWAWKSRKFDSFEQFKAVQKEWTIWGIIIIGVVFLFGLAIGILAPYATLGGL